MSLRAVTYIINTYHFNRIMAIGNDNLDVNILCIVLLDLLDRDIVMSISNGRGEVVAQGIDLSRNMSIGNSKCCDSR